MPHPDPNPPKPDGFPGQTPEPMPVPPPVDPTRRPGGPVSDRTGEPDKTKRTA